MIKTSIWNNYAKFKLNILQRKGVMRKNFEKKIIQSVCEPMFIIMMMMTIYIIELLIPIVDYVEIGSMFKLLYLLLLIQCVLLIQDFK